MKRKIISLLLLCGFAVALQAQNNVFFQPVPVQQIRLDNGLKRVEFPGQFQTFRLDYSAIKNVLQSAPGEFTAAARAHSCVIGLPMANGNIESFAVWQTAMMEPGLAAEVPYVRTYAGQSLRDGSRTVRITVSLRGFEAMVMQPDLGIVYVEPYSWNQDEFYMVYDRTSLPTSKLSGLDRGYVPGQNVASLVYNDVDQPYVPKEVENRGVLSDPLQLKVYRFVVGTTGEFAEDNGGTKPSTLSAVVSYVNKLSGLFERDIDLRLQLITGEQNVIFTDANTDPYTGTQVGDWMGQNPGVMNQYVGSNSHDLGHVFARYQGGSAIGVAGGIGIACGQSRAAGCSAGTGAYGDYFVGVAGQEIGHQLGGGHTWNRCNGGGGRNGETAFEPGSGSTIMSYSGACGTDNIQGNADLYYHSGSIDEIRTYYQTQGGSACGTYLQTDNHHPVVTLPYQNNFFIPISTPFELHGSATDEDGDTPRYRWEEVDAGPETPLGMPSGNTATFRTWVGDSLSSHRVFPRLLTIITNQSSAAEQLPTYTRDLTFRLMVRDNRPNGGGIGWADVAFQAYQGAGPFLVLTPNAPTAVWNVGEYVNVTWDVANTNVAPVNCQHVNILLSTDGGFTYPITLASNVVNDGSQYVLVPDAVTAKARVRVEAADNVFFDISNTNFKIQQATQPSFSFGLSTDAEHICLPAVYPIDILSSGLQGFANPVSLDVTGNLPPGAVATFTQNTITPGQSCNLSLDFNDVHVGGVFTFSVRAVVSGTNDTIQRPVTVTLYRNEFTNFALTTPPDGSNGLGLAQNMHWAPSVDALTYDFQVSKTPSFDSLVYTKVGTSLDSAKIAVLLEKGTGYYWRVRPNNECGSHDWTAPFFFSTYTQSCKTFTANDLPAVISTNGMPTVQSQVIVNSGGTISAVNIKQIAGYHDAFGDLEAHLISPTGTDVTLFKKKCGFTSESFNFALTDDAPNNFSCPPPNNGAAKKPASPLSAFIGQSSTGTWTLKIKDLNEGSGGSFDGFQIEFCATVALQPPYLVNNNVLYLTSGTNKGITSDLLQTDDPNNTHAQLVYTLVSVPKNGALEKNFGATLKPGDQFTQADIDNGALRFFDYGGPGDTDGFRFVVTDNEGGFVATPTFVISTIVVATQEPVDFSSHISLFPNPANGGIWVAMDRQATVDTRITVFDASGRLVQQTVLPAGADRLHLSTTGMAKGLYAVRLETEGGVGVKRFVVAE